MHRSTKRFLGVVFILFFLIQFYQPERNIENTTSEKIDFLFYTNAPDEIQYLIYTSCYDCHSNKTVYPWYSNIQPFRILIDKHIKNGKKNLNFSDWGSYSKRKKETKTKRIIKEIISNQMPLKSYILIHKNADLDTNQKKSIVDWLQTIQN